MNEMLKPQNIKDIFIDSPAGEGIGPTEEQNIKTLGIQKKEVKIKVSPKNGLTSSGFPVRTGLI